jgi:dTDP-4-dehydrorhamnose reductase
MHFPEKSTHRIFKKTVLRNLILRIEGTEAFRTIARRWNFSSLAWNKTGEKTTPGFKVSPESGLAGFEDFKQTRG